MRRAFFLGHFIQAQPVMTHLRTCLLVVLSLCTFLLYPPPGAAAETSATNKVALTFVANEGILVAGSDARILIDGIFDKSYGVFQVPSADTLTKLKTAAPPFDHLTAVLVTHNDLDHVNPSFVGQHLASAPTCAFLAPAAVVDLIRSQPDHAKFDRQLHAIPQDGAETETILNQSKIRAIPLRHMPRPPTLPEMPFNVGYLFTIDGITFFHTGDMSAENLASLQRAKLAEANIDVVLISWYAFKPENGRLAQAMIRYLNPKVVLLAHLTTKNPSADKAIVQQLSDLPPVIPLETPLRSYTVEKTGTSVTVK